MGKVVCVKDFKCEVCGIQGMLQILSESYSRVRHYKFLKNGKPVFEYHRNSIEYVNGILANIKDDQSNHKSSSGQCKASFSIDQNLNSLGLKSKDESRGSLAWFGRQTHNLENKKGANAQLSRGRGLESRPRHHFTSLDSLLGYFGQRTLICTREDIVVSSVARDRFKLSVQTFPAYYQFASNN